ncbi:MAG: alpha/beta fold hydrolase [Planctomycetes bacterium]|nr:alpha/beta fold hydrolase [Planctomycetota bacterium]
MTWIPRRRALRRAAVVFAALALGHFVAVLARVSISGPFDWLISLGSAETVETLRVPADGMRRVVVLQHGMWRTAAALNRIERTLRAHGFEVWNVGYPSLRGTIEQHAERLRDTVEQIHRTPVDELFFVGHSMGGLVIEEYLRRPDARQPTRCVYVAVPHRGALLADLRKHWFLFRWVMGDLAALQLSPGDPLHQRPLPWPERSGAIVGDVGVGNPSIPGDDDGTVAVDEARLPGARDTIVVPYGHTRIALADDVAIQVVRFCRAGAFSHEVPPR